MSKLDDILQSEFTHQRDKDGTAWGMDTVLDYDGGKQRIIDLIEGILFESDEPGGERRLRTESDILEGLEEL